MLKNPRIGEQVKWTNKPWSGIIQEIQGQRARILLNDGFEEWEQLSNLTHTSNLESLNSVEIFDTKDELQHIEIRPIRVSEIDLHIENLDVHWKQIPKEKILTRQLLAFNEEYQKSIQEKLDELIVIHGKGSGILKENIIQFLNKANKIRYEAMNYGKYKQAAIKIYFL